MLSEFIAELLATDWECPRSDDIMKCADFEDCWGCKKAYIEELCEKYHIRAD
jgi:hypothetical protein